MFLYECLTRLEWRIINDYNVVDSLNMHTSQSSGSPVVTFAILDSQDVGKQFINGIDPMRMDGVEYTAGIDANLNRKRRFSRVFIGRDFYFPIFWFMSTLTLQFSTCGRPLIGNGARTFPACRFSGRSKINHFMYALIERRDLRMSCKAKYL